MFLFITLLNFLFHAHAITGLEVMQKVDDAQNEIIGLDSTMDLVLIDANNQKVVRQMQSQVLEREEGNKSITTFTKPIDVKGTKLLTWTQKDAPNKQWLYLPSFNRLKKINSKSQSGSFMGSEFSYEDIAGMVIEKYDHKMLEDTKDYWKVESIPKSTTQSGYSKMISKISKKYLYPIEVQYYNRRNEILKQSLVSQMLTYELAKKTFYLPKSITMKNNLNLRSSIIEWTKRKIGIKHNESAFQPQRIKR